MATGPNNSVIALTPNTAPASITFKRSVALSTTDQNNNNAPIAEGYIVSGPAAAGVNPIFIAGGTKAVIPLTTSTGNGAPYLKIHFPTNPTGTTLYLTYAVANSSMADGYYDYKTGVPSSYFSALRNWINTNPSNGQPFSNVQPTLRTRSLKFSAYGNNTNKPGNAVTFYLKFQGTFGVIVNNNTESA
jgi:hypothetical protein